MLNRVAAAAVLIGACQPVLAADLGQGARVDAAWKILDEVRLGVFGHGVDGQPEEGSVDINLELLSRKLPIGSGAWYVPRLAVGTTINTDDDTSHVYGGFAWTIDLGERFFVEATFGGGAHDGDTGPDAPPGDTALGCSVLFRESASVGVRLNGTWALMETVEHLSNAHLCDANRGITNAGARLSYRF